MTTPHTLPHTPSTKAPRRIPSVQEIRDHLEANKRRFAETDAFLARLRKEIDQCQRELMDRKGSTQDN